jgi:hypothetical protein
MSGEERKKKYPVGYCRPPLDTRFKTGQSGNPAGRRRQKNPKGAANVAAVLAEIFNEKVTVREGETTRTMTRLEAFIRSMVNSASQGKPTAIAKIMSIASEAKLIGEAPGAEKFRGVIVVESGPSEGFKTVAEETAYQQRPHREQS